MFRKMLFALAVFAPGCTDHVAECNKAKVAARDAWGDVVQAKDNEVQSARAAKNKAEAHAQTAEAQYSNLENVQKPAARRPLYDAKKKAMRDGFNVRFDTHFFDFDDLIAKKFRLPELTVACQSVEKATSDARTAAQHAHEDAREAGWRQVRLEKRRDELDEIAKSAAGGAIAFRDKAAAAIARSDTDAEVVRAILEAKPAIDAAWEACKDVAP